MKPPPSPTSEPKTLIAKAKTKSQRLSAAAVCVKQIPLAYDTSEPAA